MISNQWESSLTYKTDTKVCPPGRNCSLYLVLAEDWNPEKVKMLSSSKFKLLLKEVVDQRNSEIKLRYEQ